jgi:AICAR transformylase/IMP cyclohydrolase PurH
VSAFGGVLITTARIDKATAEAIDTSSSRSSQHPTMKPMRLEVLMKKKNRMILKRKPGARGRA